MEKNEEVNEAMVKNMAIRWGRWIAAAREDLGLSVRGAAEKADISEGLWRQLEKGYRQVTKDVAVPVSPRTGTITRVAQVLGLEVGEAFDRLGRRDDLANYRTTQHYKALAEHPVGLGLDAEAADLTSEQIESVRAVIRAMKPAT